MLGVAPKEKVKRNGKGMSCDASERNLIGMQCSMPRPQERLVCPLRVFFVLIAHLFFHLVIMFHNFLSFILFSFVVNHSESSVRSQSSSGCSRV